VLSHFSTLNDASRKFQAGDLPFNYGALPQTWEDPRIVHPQTGLPGDNDPLDAVEISTDAKSIGEVCTVKILGALALLDQGETDWKIIVLDKAHPSADAINNLSDAERLISAGLVDRIREWFRTYKIAEGKGENRFAVEGALDRDFALQLIEDTHQSWKRF
jgi:inorganic pyrophosphatase